ncbi:MAG: DUF4442 domain-containing protein [Burkholderiales bacterium]|nr:DUF4442 domain-containing protein [Bacteroidia bacterium]
MNVSESILKWAMRMYPPFLLQRIWVQKIYPGFKRIDVKINKSLFTMNFGKSIFGGTIYSAADPFYALLFGQILRHDGMKVNVWLKSGSIKFLKPGRTDLYYSITITDDMILELKTDLNKTGLFIKTYTIEIVSKHGHLHAIAKNEIHIRNKTKTKN